MNQLEQPLPASDQVPTMLSRHASIYSQLCSSCVARLRKGLGATAAAVSELWPVHTSLAIGAQSLILGLTKRTSWAFGTWRAHISQQAKTSKRILREDAGIIAAYGFAPLLQSAQDGMLDGRWLAAKASARIGERPMPLYLCIVLASATLAMQISPPSRPIEALVAKSAPPRPAAGSAPTGVSVGKPPAILETSNPGAQWSGVHHTPVAATNVDARLPPLDTVHLIDLTAEKIIAQEALSTSEHGQPGQAISLSRPAESVAPRRSHLHEAVIREVENRMAAAKADVDRKLLSELAGHYRAIGARLHWVDETGLTADGSALRRELETADDYGLDPDLFVLAALQAPEPQRNLAALEADLSYSAILYARHARGWRIDPSQLSRWLDQRPTSFYVSEVFRAIELHGSPVDGLRRFHPRHDQFERLRQAYLAERQDISSAGLKLTPDNPQSRRKTQGNSAAKKARLDTLRVNMERWRWMPEDLGNFHIWNNLPEFETRVVKNNEIIHQERLIIGKETTQTPVFSDEMSYIEFNPEWGVPESIKIRQLLPRLRGGDIGVLARRNMRIKFGNEIKNPSKFRWSKIDIRSIPIVQGPGPGNPLGRIKFMFPNHHSVYMHDTIDQHLFKSNQRTFSYGCMRVRNPQRLAEVVLADVENLSSADVQDRLNRKEMNRLYLSRRIKVHNTYFTQWVDSDGTLQEYKDVYGHDRRIAEALAGKPVGIIAQRDPALALQRENERLRSQQVASLARSKTATRPSKDVASAQVPKPAFSLFAQSKQSHAAKGSTKKSRVSSVDAAPATLVYFQIR
jgi:murein L,D-transpeptidase YcbB/YkuD